VIYRKNIQIQKLTALMANIYTSLTALSPGKKDLKVKVRVTNMWTVPDKHRLNIINTVLIIEKTVKIRIKLLM
jgi:hypothetical protein